MTNPTVPENVRFLIACVDIQKNAFVVQVFGISPGEPFDITLIDRFTIHKSKRQDDDGDTLWVRPGTYLEDWDLIEEQVMRRTYPLADDSGRRMTIKMTVSDSGGAVGVTSRAYEFVRVMRSRGLGGRFHLVKGDPKPGAPRARITYPDSVVSGNKALLRADVPVLMLHSNTLKDELSNRLDSLIPGRGLIRFPDWLADWFYGELCAEVRTDKGWNNPNGARNEAWDLFYYCIGVCISRLIGVEGFDWNNPPSFALPWDRNPLVIAPDAKEAFAPEAQPDYDFGKLAQVLA